MLQGFLISISVLLYFEDVQEHEKMNQKDQNVTELAGLALGLNSKKRLSNPKVERNRNHFLDLLQDGVLNEKIAARVIKENRLEIEVPHRRLQMIIAQRKVAQVVYVFTCRKEKCRLRHQK